MYFGKKKKFKRRFKRQVHTKETLAVVEGETLSMDSGSKSDLYQIKMKRSAVIQECDMQILTKTDYNALSH